MILNNLTDISTTGKVMGDFALDETALPMANAYNKQIEDQVCNCRGSPDCIIVENCVLIILLVL